MRFVSRVGPSPKNQEGQERDGFSNAFSPEIRIEEGPELAGGDENRRQQSHGDRSTGNFGERNTGGFPERNTGGSNQSKGGEMPLRDAGGKHRIGMQELSFIKKDAGNASDCFIDSFLHDKDLRFAYNIEYDGVIRNGPEDGLSKNLMDNNGFKDVEAEEFDLEDSAPLIEDQSNLEVLKKISEATRKAASSITRPDSIIPPNELIQDSEPSSGHTIIDSPDDIAKVKNNKFNEIDKISEDDAEYEDDDSQGSGLARRRGKSKKCTTTIKR